MGKKKPPELAVSHRRAVVPDPGAAETYIRCRSNLMTRAIFHGDLKGLAAFRAYFSRLDADLRVHSPQSGIRLMVDLTRNRMLESALIAALHPARFQAAVADWLLKELLRARRQFRKKSDDPHLLGRESDDFFVTMVENRRARSMAANHGRVPKGG